MEIKFVRSGGLAGRMTRVEGTVTFYASRGVVTSEADNYRRDLLPAEAERLRSAAYAATDATKSARKPSPVRDAYSYLVTVLTDDGKTHEVTLDESLGASHSPGLSDWVQEEAQKIWEHRISKP